MEEARRLHCLRMLGIERFVPRRRLPGAGEHAVHEHVAGSQPAPSPQQQPAPSKPRPAAAPPAPRRPRQRPASPPSQEHAPVAAPAPPLAFTFAVAAIDDVVVVDSLPHGEEIPKGWQRFLGNLLLACRRSASPKQEKAELLALVHWPRPGWEIDKSADSARDYVLVTMEKILAARQCRHMLLMGDQAVQFAFPSDTAAGACTAIKCSSAAAAMADGALKARLWQELQPLRGQML